jgi:hypothetical protein
MKKILGFSLMASAMMVAAANAAEVDRRLAYEQARINQGIRSGALTYGEAYRLERQEAHIGREVARDRAFHGGHLTPGEWTSINRQENRLSNHIYYDKHNAWRR